MRPLELSLTPRTTADEKSPLKLPAHHPAPGFKHVRVEIFQRAGKDLDAATDLAGL
jgi:hypothetical protein